MVQNAGFVDSNRASYVPFKLEGETITNTSDSEGTSVYGYNGDKLDSVYVVTNALTNGTVVPVKLGATEGGVQRINSNTDTIIGYTNGDPVLELNETAPIRYCNIRVNGHIMSGKPTTAITYGATLAYDDTEPVKDGYPTLTPLTTDVTAFEGKAMIALQAATAADVTAGKLIDYIILI